MAMTLLSITQRNMGGVEPPNPSVMPDDSATATASIAAMVNTASTTVTRVPIIHPASRMTSG